MFISTHINLQFLLQYYNTILKLLSVC